MKKLMDYFYAGPYSYFSESDKHAGVLILLGFMCFPLYLFRDRMTVWATNLVIYLACAFLLVAVILLCIGALIKAIRG